MFSTYYPLPFELYVSLTNPWDGSAPVQIIAEVVEAASEEQFDELDSIVFGFWALGSAGGLCGETIEPWRSTADMPQTRRERATISWTFEYVLLDELATQCLANLLLVAHATVPLRTVWVQRGQAHVVRIGHDTRLMHPYPGCWPKPPFSVTIDDSEDENRTLELRFQVRLTDTQRDAILGDLLAWAAAVSVGAFGIQPSAPQSCGFWPTDEFEIEDHEFSWSLPKCRFHAAAFDSLIHVCGTIHVQIAPIVDLQIS